MSFAYVSSPGVPGMWPRNLSGVGTVADAGRWSTSSVVMRGSVRYSLIFAVYAASLRCAGAAWPRATVAFNKQVAMAAGAAQRRKPEVPDILPPMGEKWGPDM